MKTDDMELRRRHRFRIAHADFSRASDFAALLLKRGWVGPKYGARTDVAVQQLALTTAFIIAYARPFSRNFNWDGSSGFPPVEAVLDEEETILHERLVGLRNGVFAHSDGQHYDHVPFEVAGFKSAIETMPGEHLEKGDLQKALVMLGKFRTVANMQTVAPPP